MTYERNQIIGILYRIFQAERWYWYKNNNEGYQIPTYEEMKKFIERLEKEAYTNKIVETGRIQVSYDKSTQSYEYYLHL